VTAGQQSAGPEYTTINQSINQSLSQPLQITHNSLTWHVSAHQMISAHDSWFQFTETNVRQSRGCTAI